MIGTQVVVALLQRVNLVVVVEETGHPEVTLVVGDGIEVIHRLVEAAKLIAQHAGALILGERLQFVVGPIAHATGHLKRGFIATECVLVDESLQYLVQRVEGSPHTLAGDVAVDESLTECREVACAVLPLNLGESLHQRIGLLAHLQIGHGREQMTGDVAPQVAVHRLPSGQVLHGHIASLTAGEHTRRVAERME